MDVGASSAPWRRASATWWPPGWSTSAGAHPGSCPGPPPPRPSWTVAWGPPRLRGSERGRHGRGTRWGRSPLPGRTHVVGEGAGVDGDAKALGLCAVCARAVQHVRHGAHDAHHHRLAAVEEAIEEGRRQSTEQVSLGEVGPVGRGCWDPCLCSPRTPALPGRPRTNSDSALPRPPSRPGHLHCPSHPAGSRPGSAHEGNELRALVCPLGAVDRLRTGFSSLSHWGSSWGEGSISPVLVGSQVLPVRPHAGQRAPTKPWRPPFPSSAPPCLYPHSWPPHGSERAWGAGGDKFGQVGTH